MAYPGSHIGWQIVPLGMLMQASTIPKGRTAGKMLQGLGIQIDDPLQTPAMHFNVELAVKPLLHIGLQLKPLSVPAQWLSEPYNRGLKGTV